MTEEKPKLRCPLSGCRHEPTFNHFRSSPACAAAMKSLIGIYASSQRETMGRAGGRPPIIRKCGVCGKQCTTVEMRSHKCPPQRGTAAASAPQYGTAEKKICTDIRCRLPVDHTGPCKRSAPRRQK